MRDKIKTFQLWESVGTIIWLTADFLWMCSYNLLAGLLSFMAASLLLGACILYKNFEKSKQKMSELYALSATACWCLMNMCWINSDIAGKGNNYLLCAKVFFILAMIFVYCSFRASKKEKHPVDFKRLKINK